MWQTRHSACSRDTCVSDSEVARVHCTGHHMCSDLAPEFWGSILSRCAESTWTQTAVKHAITDHSPRDPECHWMTLECSGPALLCDADG